MNNIAGVAFYDASHESWQFYSQMNDHAYIVNELYKLYRIENLIE